MPLLIGTLTCNTKDQKPFDVILSQSTSAVKIYKKACIALENQKTTLADSLFSLAKDLDGIRFRAPAEINEIIRNFGKKFHISIIDIDSVFRSASRNHIVGNEWMTDHLHPTLEGQQMMGRAYYECLHRQNLLPAGEPFYVYAKQDSLAKAYFMITDMDRKIGEFTILKLKNDWPFINPDNRESLVDTIEMKNKMDSLSWQVANHEKKWAIAHLEMAHYALDHDDMETFLRHMDILIYQYPVQPEIYDGVIHELLKADMLIRALPYLIMRYRLGTNAYISKWIGIAFSSLGDHKKAISYLEESISLDPDDAQNYFNLGVSCFYEKLYGKAEQALEKCLAMDPSYPDAKNLIKKIENLPYLN